MKLQRSLLCAALVLASPFAAAGVYTVSGTGDAGTSGNSLVVTFAGDGSTVDTEATYTFSNANITLGAGVASNGAQCLSPTATSIRVVPPSGGATPLTGTATTYCTYPVTVNAGTPAGLIAFTESAIECLNAMAANQTCTTAAGAGFTVTANNPPTIGAGAFTAGMPSGTEGTVAAIGNVNFAITTAAAGTGTGSVQCADAAGGPTFTLSPSTAITVNSGSASPISVGVSCPLSTFGGGAVNGDVTCTVTDSAGTRNETINIACPEGADATGPVLTAPVSTVINLGATIVGQSASGSIQYSAAGGDAGQSTALVCSVVSGPVSIVSGGNQTVTTGSQPAPVIVSMTSAVAAQVATVSCNGTEFTINAAAGLVPPEVIPASSLWSQLSLIGLLAGLGGLMVALRRNA